MTKIIDRFYKQTNTVKLAKELLGKVIFSNINNEISAGIISETEAYCGSSDKACHAYNYRKTKRTLTMFEEGGVAYIYLCYGIHHLLNIVTNIKNEPHAVLIRGIIALKGTDIMSQRVGRVIQKGENLNGPGKLTRALGITTNLDNTPLSSDVLWLEDRSINIPENSILISPRIGIDYAGEDAHLPYRFNIKEEYFPYLK
ncbi:MAG: DNA-3-methyladenine glycosylase [Bacteroidota bacterium]